MKRIYSFLLIISITIFISKSSATVWQLAAGADLYTTYNNVAFQSGDIIELTTDGGAYTWGTRLSNYVSKSVIVKSAIGLTTRPVITLPSGGVFIQVNNSTNNTPVIEFNGIEFIGNSVITNFIIAGKTTTGGTFSLNINNCKFSGFPSNCNFVQYANSQATTQITQNYGDLTVTNSIFIGGASVIIAGSVVGSNHFNVPNNMIFVNNYFKDMTGSIINSNTANMLSNSLLINHCTFDGCATTTLKEISVGSTATTGAPTVIKNTLFANRGASTTANILGGTGVEANVNNAVYYSGSGVAATIYPISVLGDYVTAGLNVDPVIGSNYVATASAYYNTGSDGKTIGYVGPGGISTKIDKQILASGNALKVIQNGSLFTLNSEDAAYAIYSVNGTQVANGQINNGTINLNLNKGIYILKSNGKVAKFVVK